MGFYDVFNIIFFKPLLNGFFFLINYMPHNDAGLAVISLTILVRMILFPLSHIGSVNQIKMRYIQKDIESVKLKFKDKVEQAREIMNIYKAHGLNPFSSFLLVLVQIPILIALWQVFWKGLGDPAGHLYSFVSLPSGINTYFLGFDLKNPSLILGALAGALQFVQMKILYAQISEVKKQEGKPSFEKDFSRIMSIQMTYMLPLIIVFASLKFPAAVALYWITMTVFAIIHESWVKKKIDHDYRRKQEANPGGDRSRS
jgi:YidC/Oxa1 family membrane protein insertase